MTTNTNCLAAIACPRCGSADEFVIRAECAATVTDDGVTSGVDFDWLDDSYIRCCECDHEGIVTEFTDQVELLRQTTQQRQDFAALNARTRAALDAID